MHILLSAPSGARKGTQIPWCWIMTGSKRFDWALETELGFSTRTVTFLIAEPSLQLQQFGLLRESRSDLAGVILLF